MYLTPKLPFVVEVHVIMLVYCCAQENSLRSGFQSMDSSQQMPYLPGKDLSPERRYAFEKEAVVTSTNEPEFSDGHQTYLSADNNSRCKGTLCIDFAERSRRRHHHKKPSAYHNRNTYHKHKKSRKLLKNPFSSYRPIKAYKFTSVELSNKERPPIASNDQGLSNSTWNENNFFGKLISSNNDWTTRSAAKLGSPESEVDFVSASNKQKIIDSKVLSARNDLSNFFPNHVSGENKNFVRSNRLNQTERKPKSLDESITQILQKEDLSFYFPSGKKTKDADMGSPSLGENQLLTSALDKKINYKQTVSDFDQSRNRSKNSSGELSSIMVEPTEQKVPPNENPKSNKVQMRSKLISVSTPGIQYRAASEIMEPAVNNKKQHSSPTKDYSLSESGLGNGLINRIIGQKKKEPSFVSFLRQNALPTNSKHSTPPDRQCYSVSDLLMVVLITSLANLCIGFVVTLTLCCISPRLRLLSSFRRTTESFSIGITHSRLNLSEEEVSGNVGCLEACLPDISYQRHVARDTPKGKMSSRKLNSCFQHFQGRKRGPKLFQPGSQEYSSLHKADHSPLVDRKSLSLEDLRVT